MFTPEYSTQLWQQVVEVWTDSLKGHYPQLKLQRLLDLLEFAEELLEEYLKNAQSEQGQDKSNALRSFIMGAYYIYLVVPQSIQYQTRNKSHTIYNDLKILYENQTNMTNALIMVKGQVDLILEDEQVHNTVGLITRNRAYSVPSNNLDNNNSISHTQNYNQNNINNAQLVSKQLSQLQLENLNNNSNNIKTATNIAPSDLYSSPARIDQIHNHSDNEAINSPLDAPDQYIDMDDNSTLWTAPILEPNDQLKLATEMDYSNDDLVLFDLNDNIDNNPNKAALNTNNNNISNSQNTLSNKYFDKSNTTNSDQIRNNPTFFNNNKLHKIQSVKESKTQDFNDTNTNSNYNINNIPTDRSLTHRKNSYHSVYMIENDDSMDNNNYYDESNQFIQSLDRLQKQSIITAPELFCLLSNAEHSKDLLLIDLRLNSRFKKNKIVAPNVLHIDPNLLWDNTTNSPIYEISHLEKLLNNNELFMNRDKFKYIVYFSDTKTFMKLSFDYNFTLFYLLNTSRNKPLHCVPTFLLGSFEKWKKVIGNYSKQYDINPDDFILKTSKDGNTAIKRISLIDPTVKKPEVPVPDKIWQPIKVPNRIRKRPPPPPPSRIPESPKILPKVPNRIKIENKLNSANNDYNIVSTNNTVMPLNSNTIIPPLPNSIPPPLPNSVPPPIPSVLAPPLPNSVLQAQPISFNSTYSNNINNNARKNFDNVNNQYSFITGSPMTISHHENRINNNHGNFNRINKNVMKRNIPSEDRTYYIPTIEKSPNLFTSLSITGLRNLGNTCYINSMLQCLFAARTFRDLFLSAIYRKYLKPDGNSNEPRISNSLHILFNKMYLNGGCSVVPISFIKVCNILRPDLRIPDDQQDTTEFLLLILDRLHDELSNQVEVVNEYPDLMLYDTERLNVHEKDYKEWFDKTVIGNGLSPIDDIFQGQTENSLQCQRCGHSSNNYSTFYMLSLAIPKPQGNSFSKNKRVSLEDCLNMYTSDEVLSGENAWECSKCCKIKKDYHNAKQKSKITKQKLKETNSYLSPTSSNPSTLLPPNDKNSSSSSRRSRLFKFASSTRNSLDNDNHHGKGSATHEIHKLSRSLSPFRVLGGNSNSRSANNNSNINPLTSVTKDSSSITSAQFVKQKLKQQSQAEDEDLREIKDEMKNWKTKKLITIKTLNFISLPQILVIHLSRFFYDLTKKNDTLVSYPFKLSIVLKNGDVVNYRLFGLVNHTGNLISGHYTSLVNKDLNHSLKTDEQKWYYFDDEIVKQDHNHGDRKKNIDKVYSNNVYVLFYEKVK